MKTKHMVESKMVESITSKDADYTLTHFVKIGKDEQVYSIKEAIIWAIENDKTEVLGYLSQSVYKSLPIRIELLCEYVVNGNIEKIMHLLNTDVSANTINLVSEDKKREKLVETACKAGYDEIAKLLLKHGAKPTLGILNIASVKGMIETVKQIVDMDVIRYLESAVVRAIDEDHHDIARYLINNGADPDLALCEAVRRPNFDTCMSLINIYAADIDKHEYYNKNYNGHVTVLEIACIENHIKFRNYLLDLGIKIPIRGIKYMVKFGSPELVQIGIDHMDCNEYDKYYNINACVVDAARYGKCEILQVLIDNSADITTDNNDALKIAASAGHIKVVEMLIKNGANVNDGSSPHDSEKSSIFLAAKSRHHDIVVLLLKHGATFN